MSLDHRRIALRSVTGLALALMVTSVTDNHALCPDGERLLRWAEVHGGGEGAPVAPPAACATDPCETPTLVPALPLLGPIVTRGEEVLVASFLLAGLGAPAPPRSPPKRDAFRASRGALENRFLGR